MIGRWPDDDRGKAELARALYDPGTYLFEAASTAGGKRLAQEMQINIAIAKGYRVLIIDPKDSTWWRLIERALPLPAVEEVHDET